ncbi:MAG TPA: hypothetical protein VM913_05525 [Sphingomicrobium sp.]|nr:hypothetical protein [Sphingomicrobium sp.]
MIRFVFALAATLGLAALLAASQRVGPAFGRLWRAVLMVVACVLALLGLVVAVAGLEHDAWWAAIAGGGLMLISLRLGWSARQRPAGPLDEFAAGRNGLPSTTDLADPRWRRFEKQLGAHERARAHRAQVAIRGFLAERSSSALTAEHQSLLLSLEKRVPELIDTCVERCRRARPPERQEYLDTTLKRLEQIGAQAERARVAVREADDQRLKVLHRYFDGVAPPPEPISDRR